MERISIIKDFLGLVALTKNERVNLIQELMSEWHLNELDVTAPSVPATNKDIELTDNTTTALPVPKKRGRKKKSETEKISPEAVSKASEVPIESPKKRRGRPKKILAVNQVSQTDTTEQEPEAPPTTLSKEDAALIEAAKTENILDLLNDEVPVPTKANKRRNQAFFYLADYPKLKSSAIGQEYPFEFLYQWIGKNLLSSYVLADMMPIGIYIPYKNIVFGKYRGFIVSLYDEHVVTNAVEAQNTAKAMPSIDDGFWTIMDSLQWSVLKTYIGIVNRMLSKVGGDSLKTQYKTCSPKSNQICGIGGFRYAINVK